MTALERLKSKIEKEINKYQNNHKKLIDKNDYDEIEIIETSINKYFKVFEKLYNGIPVYDDVDNGAADMAEKILVEINIEIQKEQEEFDRKLDDIEKEVNKND
jgi:hypothetical protein